MRPRVEPGVPAADHRDRGHVRRDRGGVRGTIDPDRQPGHHRGAQRPDRGRDPGRRPPARLGGASGADDRHRARRIAAPRSRRGRTGPAAAAPRAAAGRVARIVQRQRLQAGRTRSGRAARAAPRPDLRPGCAESRRQRGRCRCPGHGSRPRALTARRSCERAARTRRGAAERAQRAVRTRPARRPVAQARITHASRSLSPSAVERADRGGAGPATAGLRRPVQAALPDRRPASAGQPVGEAERRASDTARPRRDAPARPSARPRDPRSSGRRAAAARCRARSSRRGPRAPPPAAPPPASRPHAARSARPDSWPFDRPGGRASWRARAAAIRAATSALGSGRAAPTIWTGGTRSMVTHRSIRSRMGPEIRRT